MNAEAIVTNLNNMLHSTRIKSLENAYENAFIETVKFRNTHKKAWNPQERILYSSLQYKVDYAKTELFQLLTLKNATSQKFYTI